MKGTGVHMFELNWSELETLPVSMIDSPSPGVLDHICIASVQSAYLKVMCNVCAYL